MGRERRCVARWLLVTWLCLACAAAVHANAEPDRQELHIRRGNRDYACLAVQGQVNPAQWFCMLTNPMPAEYVDGGLTHPCLWYSRYQRPDPRNPNKMQDFGVLRCGFTMFPPPDVLKTVAAKLPRPARGTLRISPMPLDGMELHVKPPARQDVIGAASATRPIGGMTDHQIAEFLVVLQKNDADLADRLLLDKTGLEFEISVKLSPRGDLSWRDRLGGPAASPTTSLAQVAPERAAGMAGEQKPAVWRRTTPSRKQVLETTRPAVTSGMKTTAAGKAQLALQEIRRQERERSSKRVACKGFFTLLPYPVPVREEHMVLVEASEDWRVASVVLPMLGLPDGVVIDRIELDVSLCRGKDEYERQSVTWTPAMKWRDADRLPKTILHFPLKNLLAGLGDPLSEAVFRVKKRIISGQDRLESVEELPAVTGDIPVSDPLSVCDLLTLDVHLLDWTAPLTDPDRLVKIEISLRQGERRISRTLQVTPMADGTREVPECFAWLVPSGSLDTPGGVEANVFFRTASGKRIPWALNGRPKEQTFAGGWWIFTDDDWKAPFGN